MTGRYPITAHAVCSNLGGSRDAVLEALSEGRTRLRAPELPLPFATVCGVVDEALEPLPEPLRRWDTRQARMLYRMARDLGEATARARERWGSGRVGIFLGTSTAGIRTTEEAWAAWAAGADWPESWSLHHQHGYGAAVELLRAQTGFAGPGHVISTACSSSGKVFGTAQRMMDAGLIDAALVGGADTLCELTIRGFQALGALSETACRPFSAERNGINIGEGGALLLLEREGPGRVELLGVGESSDAHHLSAPHPEGRGAAAAMRGALQSAGVEPGEVDHINAHGTATVLNDSAEAAAIGALFGAELPVVSTKGYTGHLLGGAGALEAVFSILAIEEGRIPACAGAEPLDPALGIRVPTAALDHRCDKVLSNSFAFGGNNVSVLLGARR